MKILIASILPIEKEIYWSGINAAIFRQLSKNNDVETCYSPGAHQLQKILSRISTVSHKLLGKRINVYFNKYVSLLYARTLSRREQEFNPDLLLILGSGTELYNYKPKCTCFLVSDANFHLLHNEYSNYTALSTKNVQRAINIEKASLEKYDSIFYTSHWALESTRQNYPEVSDRLKQINFGSNIAEGAIAAIRLPRTTSELSLLTVGLDYHRKGIDKSILLSQHLNAKLTIVGTDVRYNKEDPEQLALLAKKYEEAHFFLLFSRADCTPIVINEANSRGLPVIVSKVGGMSSIVKEGINGHMVNGEKEAEMIIKNYMDHPEKYEAFRKSAYNFYRENLTWHKFEKTLLGSLN